MKVVLSMSFLSGPLPDSDGELSPRIFHIGHLTVLEFALKH